jgi:predicted RND superfamily exporter protein
VITVVSVSVVIHLVNQFIDEVEAGASGAAAVENAVGHVGMACLLTSVTNAMGFFSLPVIQAPAIQEFGLFAGVGVLLAFVATMTFAPLALLRLGRVPSTRWLHLKEGRLEALLDHLTFWVAAHRRTVFLGVVLLLAVMIPGIWQITEGTDIVRALKQDAPLRLSSEFIDQHLTGAHSLELLVQVPGSEDLTSPAVIRRILAFSRWLHAQPGVTAVLSPWEPLRHVPAALLADDDQLQVLATLLPLGVPLDSWLDTRGKTVRLSARVTSLNSERFLDLTHRARQRAVQLSLPLQATGTNYLLAQMSRALVHNQVASLACAVVMILGTITIALRSWKMGVVAAIPNLLPTIMIFGLMGWLGIELSAATTMIASVALGLFVDDTIHLLYLYRQKKQAGCRTFEAIEYALHHAGRAVIFTSLILTLGFWAGLLGSFKPTIYFSLLMGLTMLFSIVTELLVTPAVVLTLDGKGPR